MKTAQEVSLVASEVFGISLEEILGQCRRDGIVWVRHAVRWVLRKHCRKLFREIGNECGCHHKCVISSCNSVESWMLVSEYYREKVDLVVKKLFGTDEPDVWAVPEEKPEPTFEDRLFEKALPTFQKIPGEGVKSACVECDGRKWIVRATHEAKFCEIVPKLLDYEAVSYL